MFLCTFSKIFKTMKQSAVILSLFFISLFVACKKGPGVGGRASIKGTVYARNYNNSYIAVDSGLIGAIKVYIKYGDNPGVGDNVETDNTGTYIFPYLRKGNYTVYVFSKILQNNTIDTTIVKEVIIKDTKEEVVLPQFDINTFKN